MNISEATKVANIFSKGSGEEWRVSTLRSSSFFFRKYGKKYTAGDVVIYRQSEQKPTMLAIWNVAKVQAEPGNKYTKGKIIELYEQAKKEFDYATEKQLK